MEQLSIDEAFLDVTERSEYATALARRLQAQVEERLGLPSSLGVATNKLVAKIATGRGQRRMPSRATTRERSRWCRRSGKAEFLAPLPVDALWGVGPRTPRTAGRVGHSHGRRSRGGAAG